MKKFFKITMILIMISFNSIFAQWFPVYSEPNGTFTSVFFTDAYTGYVAGQTFVGTTHAVLLKTTNAGINWFGLTTIPTAETGSFFTSVFFTDANTGLVTRRTDGTTGGLILRTTNGGNTWDSTTLPGNNALYRLYFINSNTGFASGNATILKTTNAGVNWVYRNPNSSVLFQICFTDINTGYVVGYGGVIRKTTDGGDNWFTQNSGTGQDLRGIGFSDANTGFAVGGTTNSSNLILKTTNGGVNWYPVTYTYSTCVLWFVKFISPSTGYIIGNCNQILKTIDGGANWCYQESPVNSNYVGCFFTSSNTGYFVGQSQSYILKTTNGGGNCTLLGIELASNEIPDSYSIEQNYPNPFNPVTNIKFSIPKACIVKLAVFDITGKQVEELVNGKYNAGIYKVDFDASGLSSGVYFYKLIANDFTETKKMLLVK